MRSRSCRVCGLVLRDGARFCDGCGSRTPGNDAAEYKQVTVMFADVVRSMDIARTVGAERLSEIMAELVTALGQRGTRLRRGGQPVHGRRV